MFRRGLVTFTTIASVFSRVTSSSRVLRQMSTSITSIPLSSVSVLSAEQAKKLDEVLMDDTKGSGYSIEQLMELAGLSVAAAADDLYRLSISKESTCPANSSSPQRVAVFCGPGNNGGDGLVAARHLRQWGLYSPFIIYPKGKSQVTSPIYQRLLKQCQEHEIPIYDTYLEAQNDFETSSTSSSSSSSSSSIGLVVDALFGFSFHGEMREPYATALENIKSLQNLQIPVLSVDIPSGWSVDSGDIFHTKFLPTAVISLTLPKIGIIENFTGRHYIGGRFVPQKLADQLELKLPDYGTGAGQIVLLTSTEDEKTTEEKIVTMFVTASSITEGKQIAHTLIQEKLVACVNLTPNIISVYEWEDKVEESTEVLLMIKTRKSLASQVTERVKTLHSYDVPESIVLEIENDGSSMDYLNWVRHQARGQR